MFQMKKQDKTSEEELSVMEISNLPNKEFKVMIIKMFKVLGRRMNKQSDKLEVFNKELENVNKQTELKNKITEIKNTVEEINNRLDRERNR